MRGMQEYKEFMIGYRAKLSAIVRSAAAVLPEQVWHRAAVQSLSDARWPASPCAFSSQLVLSETLVDRLASSAATRLMHRHWPPQPAGWMQRRRQQLKAEACH